MPVTLDIFISSKMIELKEERKLLYDLLPQLDYGDIQVRAWVFEEDAIATDRSIRQVYLDALQNSALYIGIFWNLYGEWTIDEFDRAIEWGIERHIYVKDVDTDKRQTELSEFLNKIGNVSTGVSAKWFSTNDQLRERVKQSLDKWVQDYRSGPIGENSARLYKSPDEIIERPEILIGRDDLITHVQGLLRHNERVLLQGFSGSGKTALAAELAAMHTPVLWLRAGRNDVNAVFEALASPFDKHQEVAKHSGDNKIHFIRSMLVQSGVKLIVLDDTWNGQALSLVIRSIPLSIPVLVTSRRVYGLSKIVKVTNLIPSKAIELLGFHAEQNLANDASAETLCETLGFLAFAIRIAGINLKIYGWTPIELSKRIGSAAHDLALPLEFNERGRENVASLLQVSLNALDENAYTVFTIFGLLFSASATLELLMYFVVVDDDKTVENLKTHNSKLSHLPDNIIRQILRKATIETADKTWIGKGITTLQLHGLADHVSSTNKTRSYYYIHDLAYSYVRALVGVRSTRALEVFANYAEDFYSIGDLSFLRAELTNLLAAAYWAFDLNSYALVKRFIASLFTILHVEGRFTDEIDLLQKAANNAHMHGDSNEECNCLFGLGKALKNLGKYDQAMSYYEQSLSLAHELNDAGVQCGPLNGIAIIFVIQGNFTGGIQYSEQALDLARVSGTRFIEAEALGNLGLAYDGLKQPDQAIIYYEQALKIARELGDKVSEANRLGNIGNAYVTKNDFKQSVIYYEEALSITREIGYRLGEGTWSGSLGDSYRSLGDYKRAQNYLQNAIVISQEIGDQRTLAAHLGNLGAMFFDLNEHEKALHYFQLAHVIFTELGITHLASMVDKNIKITQNKISKSPQQNINKLDQRVTTDLKEADTYYAKGVNLKNASEMSKLQQAIEFADQAYTLYKRHGSPHADDAGQLRDELYNRLKSRRK